MASETLTAGDDGLCPVCENLSAFKISHQVNPVELLQSADRKHCIGCMLLLETLKEFDVDISSLKYSKNIISNDFWGPSLYLSGKNHCIASVGDDLAIEIFRIPSLPLLNHLTPAPCIQPHTSSSTTMAQITSWLWTCTDTHKTGAGCPPNLSVPLPTRLLEVTPSSRGTDTIRLVETAGDTAYYACLSHCWGLKPLLRTLQSNYAQHKSGIPVSSLPPTFRDAVTIARELDIPYLWIDSLCIIQDDALDWEREAADMANIYQNGRVTITASHSSGSDGGCFADASAYLTKNLMVVDANGRQHHACARKVLDHGGWPVLNRGWIFQERLLSPRVLHFGHAEVVWECFEALDCQCGRVRDPKFQRLDFKMGKKTLTDQWTVALPEDDDARVHLGTVMEKEWWVDMWRRLVDSYSRLSLTYVKDVFPAMSGAARQLQRLRGSRYVAGMWEDTLVEDLLWEATERWAPRPEEWHSPSWSWAAVSGGASRDRLLPSGAEFGAFRFLPEMGETFVVVEEVEVTPLGLDPTGRIEKAHLVLTGFVLVAEMKREFGESSVGELILFGYVTADDEDEDEKYFDFRPDYCLSAQGRGYVPEGAMVFCLKIASAYDVSGEKGEVFYLVLRRVDEPEPAFERIGRASCSLDKAFRYQDLEEVQTVKII